MNQQTKEQAERNLGENIQKMIQKAMETLSFSYAPYSNFKVAASLLAENGNIFTGCNIENAAYGPGNCAERTAIFKAVSEGKRKFLAICIVNEDVSGKHGYCPPCGICRQVMMEFCYPQTFYIILAKSKTEYQIYTLEELFPQGFGPGNLVN